MYSHFTDLYRKAFYHSDSCWTSPTQVGACNLNVNIGYGYNDKFRKYRQPNFRCDVINTKAPTFLATCSIVFFVTSVFLSLCLFPLRVSFFIRCLFLFLFVSFNIARFFVSFFCHFFCMSCAPPFLPFLCLSLLIAFYFPLSFHRVLFFFSLSLSILFTCFTSSTSPSRVSI